MQLLLSFYQRFISPLFGPSCRYYPSCSEYAKWQFETNSFIRATFATILRIAKCNKLFDGGIDYPIIDFTPPKLTAAKPNKIKIKYWIIKGKQGFVAIKKF